MFNRILSGCFVFLFAYAACAQSAESDARKSVEAFLAKVSGDKSAKVDSVRETAVPGFYEVGVGADILYVDNKGSHIFFGNVYDAKSGANLTE
ncbi:MAG: hypothetical protein HZC24_11060, partial [Rhodocyclales bacterium]|nr:hypothetical protein [Rhodocyclales bacterium]